MLGKSLAPHHKVCILILPKMLTNAALEIPIPPPRALDVVNALNTAHDKACESYAQKEKQADTSFAETRRKVLDIYQSWSVTPSEKARCSFTLSQSV